MTDVKHAVNVNLDDHWIRNYSKILKELFEGHRHLKNVFIKSNKTQTLSGQEPRPAEKDVQSYFLKSYQRVVAVVSVTVKFIRQAKKEPTAPAADTVDTSVKFRSKLSMLSSDC